MREWVIKWLGGFVSIDEAIDAIQANEDGAARRRILTLATRRLYNTIGPDDILKTDKTSGQLTFMGKPISKEEVAVIMEQARNFMDSRLWKVLQADLKYQANRRMFVESVDTLGIESGKLFTYCIDTINTRLKRLVV